MFRAILKRTSRQHFGALWRRLRRSRGRGPESSDQCQRRYAGGHVVAHSLYRRLPSSSHAGYIASVLRNQTTRYAQTGPGMSVDNSRVPNARPGATRTTSIPSRSCPHISDRGMSVAKSASPDDINNKLTPTVTATGLQEKLLGEAKYTKSHMSTATRRIIATCLRQNRRKPSQSQRVALSALSQLVILALPRSSLFATAGQVPGGTARRALARSAQSFRPYDRTQAGLTPLKAWARLWSERWGLAPSWCR